MRRSRAALVAPPSVRHSVSLGPPVISVGRHADSTIHLDDTTVSVRRAEFRYVGGSFHIVDVGSVDGTYVNRELVDSAVLANGDQVLMHRSIHLMKHQQQKCGHRQCCESHCAGATVKLPTVIHMMAAIPPGLLLDPAKHVG